MIERAKSFVVITLIAVTIWLFAENQSLGESSDSARVVFVESPSARTLITPRGWDGDITIDFKGSRAAIARARSLLDEQPIELRPGMPTVPTTDGPAIIDLVAAIGAWEPLARTGVSIASISPARAEVIAREMVDQELPVAAKLESVQTEGPVRISPERVRTRLPRAVWEASGQALRLEATLSPTDRSALPPSGPASVLANLTLPAELLSESGVAMQTRVATLSFTIRSTIASFKQDLVPVWPLVPPSDARRPDLVVDVAQDDQLISAEVTGPKEQVDRLREAGARLIAILAITSDDIDRGITSKAVGFAVLREGVAQALPEDVKVIPSKATVRLTIRGAGP